jgi:hypothetical protein
VVLQPHRRAGSFAGPAGRPRRRRADEVKSELDKVRGKEVGMVYLHTVTETDRGHA